MATNRLVNETSPYLLQHAHNPVDWYPWEEEALSRAIAQDKPIIVSIGYSACHWCHVMERECFENEQLAQLMNLGFVCIKVDREERPDLDQIYMDALQAMGLRGGWPLNVFLTPEGKPFYGGTYFPPAKWKQILEGVQQAFANDRKQIEASAESFAEALNRSEAEKYGLVGNEGALKLEHYDEMFDHLAKNFDYEHGGNNRAPKFPMPSVWIFLLRYYGFGKNPKALHHLHLTLKKMALGGIYDQIGGGFARYSTDVEWFVPHFEKMLYDNGQLISLYAEAYQLTREPLYREIVYQTIAFVESNLLSPEGGFFSALDADSEGEEGKFYRWTYEEIERMPLPQKHWFILYYNIRPEGTWEHGTNIPFRSETNRGFCEEHGLDLNEFLQWEQQWHEIVSSERDKRIRPGLDDKILASWNGLMLHGLVNAYRVFDEKRFLELASLNAAFIETKLMENGKLKHSFKGGKAKIEGYLEDYATVIQAFANLYQVSFEEKWLKLAQGLTSTCLVDFFDEKDGLFYFTSSTAEKLIARKKEIFDNVIPSSNSMMAANLLILGHILAIDSWVSIGKKMVNRVQDLLLKEPYYLSNWALVSYLVYHPVYEVAIVGQECEAFRKRIDEEWGANRLFVGTKVGSELELLKEREPKDGKTTVYICQDRTCQLPVTEVGEALELMNRVFTK